MSRASRHRILAAMLSACLLSLLGGCTPLTVLAVLGGCKDGGSNGSSGGVTGSVTTGEVRDGMTIAQTKAWFNGSDGPDNVCQAYPDGQCTWWACMRGHKIGLDVGCFASMFVRQVRQCFSAVWADGFPRCRHRFPVM